MSYLCACDHATLSTGLALVEYPSAGVQAFVQRIKRELGSWNLFFAASNICGFGTIAYCVLRSIEFTADVGLGTSASE